MVVGSEREGLINGRSGVVRVFELLGGVWTQLGENIDGITGDSIGDDVDISDNGNFIAVGSLDTNSTGGAALLYYFVNDQWVLYIVIES